MSKVMSKVRSFALGLLSAAVFVPSSSAGELIANGDFSGGQAPWWLSNVTADTNGGSLNVAVPGVANPWEAIVGQGGLSITSGTVYTLTFDAWGDTPANVLAILQLDGPPFTAYLNRPIALTTSSKKFSYTFTSSVTDPIAVLQFQLGANPAYAFHLDNVSLHTSVERVVNGDFSAGQAPWWLAGVSADTSGGVFNVVVPAATNPWEAIVGQGGIPLTTGVAYTLSFDAWASAPATAASILQLDGPPFTGYFSTPVALSTSPQHFSYVFTSVTTDPIAVLQFQLGANAAYTFHLDNVSLTEPEEPAPQAPPDRTGELLRNGTFSGGSTAPWWATPSVSLAVSQGRLEAAIASGGANPWDAIVGQSDVPVFATGHYTFRVKAWASQNATVNAIVQKDGAPFTQYFATSIALTTTPKSFIFGFTSSAEDLAAVLQFQMGGQGSFTVFLDNVSLVGPLPVSSMPVAELLPGSDFSGGLGPWFGYANPPAVTSFDTSTGVLHAAVSNGGVNTYDTAVGRNGVQILAGGDYTLTFDARASVGGISIPVIIQKNGAPFTQYFNASVPLTTTQQTFTYTFTSPFEDQAAQIVFQLGAKGAFELFLDNVSLTGPKPPPPPVFLTAVRANQTGYLTHAPKKATIAVEVTTPLPWTLFDSSNNPVASGLTKVFGLDAASGEHVHTADFSKFKTPGTEYALEVYGERSHPFDVGDDVYDQIRKDALSYFYHNRSGIEIAMPFAGGDPWTRPAGHLNVPPNLGDLDVTCFNGNDSFGQLWTGCAHSLDAIKGWYDAGDHGKYVVNGGISVWTLLNQYERSKFVVEARGSFLGDGSLNIPENANHVPDILDEARWEIEFLLSMQVPVGGAVEGVPLAGMVHHKLHDANWTGLGLSPSDDPQPRFLYPPSTAATLNLAAVGAQCARVWERIDKPFSRRCLAAAETAWQAARAHPSLFASESFTGGGAYGDNDVSDEFYWAAAELFTTTGKERYRQFMTQSPHFLTIPADVQGGTGIALGSSLGWPKTQALGTISLALVPNHLSDRDVRKARFNIARAANGYAASVPREGYGVPYAAASGYYWGSNSAVLNNMIILGLAYDFTEDERYLNAVSSGMDYILGRNPNVKSYVSGYGERPLENPHHRFWAREVDPSFPPPPPGALAGGPNTGLEDPFIGTVFPGGCSAFPAKCYADDIQSFSTNEVAINWNSPLAWTAAFLDSARKLRSHGH